MIISSAVWGRIGVNSFVILTEYRKKTVAFDDVQVIPLNMKNHIFGKIKMKTGNSTLIKLTKAL